MGSLNRTWTPGGACSGLGPEASLGAVETPEAKRLLAWLNNQRETRAIVGCVLRRTAYVATLAGAVASKC